MEWFHAIFTNKCEEKRAQKPPLKSKKTLRKEEKREKTAKKGREEGKSSPDTSRTEVVGGAGK